MRRFDPTPEQIAAHQARVRAGRGNAVRQSENVSQVKSEQVAAIPAARRGVQNKLETRYERDVLIPLKAAGEIADYKFEAVKVRLATGAYFTPDFTVWLKSGLLQLHEVKGHWREAARLRIKVAADLYPLFSFYAVRYESGYWQTEAF